MAQIENEVSHDSSILNTFQVIAYWSPTPVLRWEKNYTSIDKINYDKVLQQMWKSSTGLQEWRDVPEED